MPRLTVSFSLACLLAAGNFAWADSAVLHDLVHVPGGTFLRGDQTGPDDEQPVHEVRIATLFLARSEVTVGAYQEFVEATGHDSGKGCNRYVEGALVTDPSLSWSDPGFPQAPSHPVVCVSWEDAQAYIRWFNSTQSDYVYRLPTEAEWEYVSGITFPQRKFTALDDICDRANGVDQSLMVADTGAFDFGNAALYSDEDQRAFACNDGAVYTSPTSTRSAAPLDISDLLGNAWEFVRDCASENYNNTPRDGSAYEPEECARRGIRGGSWNTGPSFMTVPNRSSMAPDGKNWGIGFRVAADPIP